MILRVDLLCEQSDHILIIDYKTDKTVPKEIENVNQNYLLQMQQYQEAMRLIYTNKLVKLKILWVENIQFMDIYAK